MSTLHIPIGLPGSGKSTWARKKAARGERPTVIVCRDDLRSMLYSTPWSPENEEFTKEVEENITYIALAAGRDVVMADTNFDPAWRSKVKYRAIELFDSNVCEYSFYVPIETCIERDAARSVGCVGEDVIRNMATKYDVGEDGVFAVDSPVVVVS